MRHLLVTGLALALLAIGAPAPRVHAETLDKIVAVAGNDVILESELDHSVAQVRDQSQGRADRLARNVLRSQVLDRLIMRQLQVERAQRHHIKVSDSEIHAGLARIAKQNHMSVDRFMRAVTANGMSRKQMRAKVRQQLLISKLRRRQVMSKVTVSDGDIDRYLQNQTLQGPKQKAYRLRHILVGVPDGASHRRIRAARERAQGLRAKIAAGKIGFAAAASRYSQGQNGAQGGQLGWMEGAYMPKPFADAVAGLKPGQVSHVFRGPSGFHLVKLENVRGGAPQDQPTVMVDEVQARHLLLKPNQIRTDDRTRKLAHQLHQRLAAGDDFAALARQYSDDKTTVNQGGELGWLVPKRVGPSMQHALAGLSAGQISPVFRTRQGYEIVMVEDKRRRDQTRQAMRQRARKALGEKKAQEQGQRWLRKVRDESYVDIRMKNYQPRPDSGS